MHYFANPNSDGTTSGGDFEFSVMKIGNDTIDLKGRTTGNKMRLIRLPENTDWKKYLEDISGIESEMFTSYQLTEDGNVEGILTLMQIPVGCHLWIRITILRPIRIASLQQVSSYLILGRVMLIHLCYLMVSIAW